jgi:photosystem II stability/assembly factor-like uncharacterized protein
VADAIEYQRGEDLVDVLVVEESTDGGQTWHRRDLTGCSYARDIRAGRTEDKKLLLAIRSTGTTPYAALEDQAVLLPHETTASTVGVISVRVPNDVAEAALPAGSWGTDDYLTSADGTRRRLSSSLLAARSRVTVLP